MNDSTTTECLSSAAPLNKAAITLHLMGPFKLIINNHDSTHLLTYDKVKLLLAILSLSHDRPVTRERLADMLWPDAQDDKGRARVRHALHTLRQAFSAVPDALVSDASGLRLNPAITWVDALHIVDTPERLTLRAIKARLEHYTGHFLDGIKLPQSELLLSWQQSWTARLELELTQYRSKLIDKYLDNGDTQAALNHAKLWVYRWPEDEACHRLLIRLLLLSGDRDAALSAFQHCCDVLNKRLGVMPSAETRALLGLENQPLSTQSLIHSPHIRESTYRPIATVAIALAWRPDESSAQPEESHTPLDDEAEDALQTIQIWHAQLLAHAQQHGAWLSHAGATTILAHFGYPALSERPITYAVQLAKNLTELDTPPNVSVGLAIHSDLVLVDQAQELSLNGLLCQTAIPLAWEAAHQEVLLSPQAAARMADWPIDSFTRADREYFQLSRDEPTAALARMHGRLREFDTLIQQWTRHRPGQKPVAVHITGLPGVGKSQLSQAMAGYVRNVDGRVIMLQSHENHHDTPLHAMRSWLCSQLELPGTLDIAAWTAEEYEQVLLDMSVRFRLSPEDSQALLNTVLPGRSGPASQGDSTAVNAAFMALHHSTGSAHPILIVWDDTHWNDATSDMLLQQIIASRGTAITMLVCTSRHALPADSDVPAIQIELGPLDVTTTAEYVVHQTKKNRLSRDAKAELVENSVGIPLYTRELLHLRSLGLRPYAIPRVTDMLSAQLLRLEPDTRHLAYLFALLQESDTSTAMQILGLDQDTIASGLTMLIKLGIVQRTEYDDNTSPIHCPHIISRCIQRLMIRRKKQMLCEQIAHHLIRQRQPAAVVAEHLHQAQSTDTGIWWRRAVQDALQQGSAEHAAQYMTHALISGHYTHAESDIRQNDSGDSAEAHEHHAVSSAPGNPQTTLAVLWNEWVVQHNQGNLPTSLHIAQRLQQLAAHHRHDVWHGWALYAQAQHDLWMGNPVISESLLLESLASIQQNSSIDQNHSTFGSHSYALAYAALGWAQALQGRYSTALQNTRHAMQLTLQNSSTMSSMACALHLLRIHYLANNLKSLKSESNQLLKALPAQSSHTAWHAAIMAYGVLPLALKQPTEKIVQAVKTAHTAVQRHMPVAADGYMCMLARCQIAMNKPEEAMHLLNQAAAIGQARQSRLLASEIHCIRSDAWLALQRPDLAQHELQKARTIALQYSLLAYDEWANERLEALAG